MVKGYNTVLKMIRGLSFLAFQKWLCRRFICTDYTVLSPVCSTSPGTATSIRNSGPTLKNQTMTVLAKGKELVST